MSDGMIKTPTMTKIITLPEDLPVGIPYVTVVDNLLGLNWAVYYTVTTTGKGLFEIKCCETSLCRWEFIGQMEVVFRKGQRVKDIVVEQEVQFSQKIEKVRFDEIEEGAKCHEIQMKMTKKSSFGVPDFYFINFEKQSKWLDVIVKSDDDGKKLYASSAVLALTSPILRQQFEETESFEIVISFEYFPALEKLLNFLHPPFNIEMENIEEVLQLASDWQMESVLVKFEQFMIRNRSFNPAASLRCMKIADKFNMRNLLEDVLTNDLGDTIDVINILEGNNFSTWVRAAIFEYIMDNESYGFHHSVDLDTDEDLDSTISDEDDL